MNFEYIFKFVIIIYGYICIVEISIRNKEVRIVFSRDFGVIIVVISFDVVI